MSNKAPMNQYGSSDLTLWHFFTVFLGVTLVLIPVIGSFMAIVVLLLFGTLFAKWVSNRDHRSYYQVMARNTDYLIFVEELDNRLMKISLPTLSTRRSKPKDYSAKLHHDRRVLF